MNGNRAADFAAIGAAALAGHEMGDYGAQTDEWAREKAHPDYNITPNVPYRRTWVANQAHVATYHAALSASVAVAAHTLGIRIRPRRALAALAVSWATHTVIDRRWPVEKFMKWTGSGDWFKDGAPLVDQMMHRVILVALAAYMASGDTPSHKR